MDCSMGVGRCSLALGKVEGERMERKKSMGFKWDIEREGGWGNLEEE